MKKRMMMKPSRLNQRVTHHLRMMRDKLITLSLIGIKEEVTTSRYSSTKLGMEIMEDQESDAGLK